MIEGLSGSTQAAELRDDPLLGPALSFGLQIAKITFEARSFGRRASGRAQAEAALVFLNRVQRIKIVLPREMPPADHSKRLSTQEALNFVLVFNAARRLPFGLHTGVRFLESIRQSKRRQESILLLSDRHSDRAALAPLLPLSAQPRAARRRRKKLVPTEHRSFLGPRNYNT